MNFSKFFKYSVSVIILSIFLVIIGLLFQEPTHNRDWERGQEKVPAIRLADNEIRVDNFRDFVWREDGQMEVNYGQKEFDLEMLEGVDVIISHFSDFEGLAHIFLSFRFVGGENMVISVETRRETDEEFSPWQGLLRRFEIIYVIGSERDIIGVRTDIRKERVYIYPVDAPVEKVRELLLLLIGDANYIYQNPTFYNTLSNNCINAITKRVEEISEIKFPLSYKTILPGFMDEVLYEIKLIPHDRSFEEIKNFYLVDNDAVNRDSSDYSEKIRK